jgi:hypothetical protein
VNKLIEENDGGIKLRREEEELNLIVVTEELSSYFIILKCSIAYK